MLRKIELALAFLAMTGGGALFAYPISSCTNITTGSSWSCNVYTTNASGNISDDTGLIGLPAGDLAGPGFLVILDAADGGDPYDPTNLADWDAVLYFDGDVYPYQPNPPSGPTYDQLATEIELFTGAEIGSTITVTSGPAQITLDDDNTQGVTTYNSGLVVALGSGPYYEFVDQNANGIYTFGPTGSVTYTIYDVAATEAVTPEPSTFGLALLAVAGLWAARALVAKKV